MILKEGFALAIEEGYLEPNEITAWAVLPEAGTFQ
mgnify:CR=1 FL=1